VSTPPRNGPSAIPYVVGEDPEQASGSGSSPPALAADGTPLWDGYVSVKDRDLRREWGLKLSLWKEIREEGGGGCPICLRRNVRLVVDEDHETGEFRGTPCDPCNRKLTERMVAYILDPPARRVARRLGLSGLFVPEPIREDKARRRRERQAKRVAKRTGPVPDRTTPDDYHARVTAALEATKQGGTT
jgi:Recombination endonuclease VII